MYAPFTVAPLVSCIMPTCNRRAFVPHAIRYFIQQDYENKELLIVDDGMDCIEDLVPQNNQVRYIRLHYKTTLGEKRNFCVRESRGNLIMHWDDDDWMAPWRISYQVGELQKQNAEVCGVQQMLYYELKTGKSWLYQYPAYWPAWLAGGSLLYTRSFWQKRLFPAIQVGSDTQFVWAKKMEAFAVLPNYQFYVALIHENNTSPKTTAEAIWQPYPTDDIQKLLSADWPFYAGYSNEGEKPYLNMKNDNTHKESDRNEVSACLLAYNRPGNLQPIIDSLHHYPFINEILVWNNNAANKLHLSGSKVRVINATENMICYGRFLCAQQAKNSIVYFQDDDAIIDNVSVLYQAFLKDSSCITYALSSRHYQVRDKYNYASGQVAFLGWGSFIKKSWIGVLDLYLQTNENDNLFRREADKFFTLLLGKYNNTMLANMRLLEHDSTPGIALYLQQDHTLCVALAIRKALAYNRTANKITYPVTWNIVITCMNYGSFLEEAVHSVLYNHADYIITIVDDASSDNTPSICQKLMAQYPFINYIRNEHRMGAGFARNAGVASVDSIFVVLLDADDKLGPEYLFEAERMLRKGYDVVNPDAILFGKVSTRWPVPEKVSLAMQLAKNHVHCCAGFRRSYWAQVGGLDEKMQCWEDYEFWIRLAEAGARIVKLPGNHFYYRQHGVSRSTQPGLHHTYDPKSYIASKHKKLFAANGKI
jgi:glycosyltransferase involved in cell wall biosynthesis